MSSIDWHARATAQAFDGRALIGGKRVASLSGETWKSVV